MFALKISISVDLMTYFVLIAYLLNFNKFWTPFLSAYENNIYQLTRCFCSSISDIRSKVCKLCRGDEMCQAHINYNSILGSTAGFYDIDFLFILLMQ